MHTLVTDEACTIVSASAERCSCCVVLQVYQAFQQASIQQKGQSSSSNTLTANIVQDQCSNPTGRDTCQSHLEETGSDNSRRRLSQISHTTDGKLQQDGSDSSSAEVQQDRCDRSLAELQQDRSDSSSAELQQDRSDRSSAELQHNVAKDEELQSRAEAAVHRGNNDVPVLVSGAGHDGLAMANLTEVSYGMLHLANAGLHDAFGKG